MAVTISELQALENYGSTTVVPSFTSTTGRLLLVAIQRNNANPAISISTEHGSFSLVGTTGVSNRCLELHALVTTTNTTSSMTVTYAQNSVQRVSVLEADGVDSASVSAAIVQNNVVNQYNGSGAPHTVTVNLSTFASATNATFLATQALGTVAGEAGYTQVTSIGELNNFFLASEDTTPTFTTTQNFRTALGCALEIAESGGGGINYAIHLFKTKLIGF